MTPADLPPGGWLRIGSALWVRPPEGPAVRLCGLARGIRIDPGGPTVVGEIRSGGRRWALYGGRWGEVTEPSPAGTPASVGTPPGVR